MSPSPMPKEISCQNFKGLITYIRKYHGDEGVNTLISGLVDGDYCIQDKYEPTRILPIKKEHLTDPAYWVSNEFSLLLLSHVKKIVPGPNPLYTAGVGTIRESLSKTTLFVTKHLSMELLAKRAARLNARFNRTKDVQLVEITGSSAVFELNYRSGFEVTKDVCNWNMGIYTGIAGLSNTTVVSGREIECILEGSPCCRFVITWKKRKFPAYIIRRLFHRAINWGMADLIADYENTIEERDRLIEKLVVSENKYRTLFEDSFEPMSLSHEGKLIDVNPAWMNLHGYSGKSELIGRDIADFVPPADRNVSDTYDQDGRKERERMIQIRHLTKSGEPIDVTVNTSTIEYDGKRLLLSTVRDVTELKRAEEKRKQLEARIQRAEKMETVATLAGGVAHDLNNILSGIVGYPDLILMQLPDQSPLIRPIRIMQETGVKAAKIVEDLLTLTRRGAAHKEVLNLNRIISDYLESPEYRQLMSFNRKAKITLDLDGDLFNLTGSSLHLSKVLMNLISNAAEAMPDGGTIGITTANRYVDRELEGFEKVPEGEYCILSVTDTGVGISEDDREKIFEPFYSKKKMGRSGTGLGMAVIWGAMRDHRGFIHLDSKLGQGTQIKLFFPATRENISAEGAVPLISKLNGAGERILIVDDIKEQRDIATEMLAGLGYAVSTVSSGEDAVEYVGKEAPDLVILDMIMDPGMDGLETYRRLKEIQPGLKAIIVSGYSETERVCRAQEIGAGEYVKKPYTLSKIGLAVQKALARTGCTDSKRIQ